MFVFSGNAGLCVPDDEDIQAWLNDISSRFRADTGPVCADTSLTADELLDRYDADADGTINLIEVNKAINDYFDGEINLAEVNTVINLYFS